jgi:hypothetical protein
MVKGCLWELELFEGQDREGSIQFTVYINSSDMSLALS